MRIEVQQFNRPTWWEWEDYYCPACGKQAVWVEQSDGDYYVGVEHVCVACKATFYLPNGVTEIRERDSSADVVKAILAACPDGRPA